MQNSLFEISESVESWRRVPNYLCDVSSKGRVRSHDRNVTCSDGSIRAYAGRVLSLGHAASGYVQVGVYVDPSDSLRSSSNHRIGLQTRYVHHLVLLAFIGPRPTPAHECDHVDRNRRNNTPANLRWVTSLENSANSNLARGDRAAGAKLTAEDVREIRRRYSAGVLQRDFALEFSVSRSAISLIINRKNWAWVE